MKHRAIILMLCAFLAGCAATPPGGAKVQPNPAAAPKGPSFSELGYEEQRKARNAIRSMRDEALEKLYLAHPEAREEVKNAIGYAVFDASQSNILLLVVGNGTGIVVDNSNQQETYMHMARLGTGPGVGYKSYKQVLIFKDRGLFDMFAVVGGDVNASGDLTIKLDDDDKGFVLEGAISFNPLISIYQMTEHGIMLQANWGGVGYLPYDDLNKPVRNDP